MRTTEPRGLSIDHRHEAENLLAAHPVMVDKIHNATGLPRTEVPDMLCEVLRFLSLIVASGRVLTPPHQLDLAWHEFILFTKVYAAWCQKHLNRFVHHMPGGSTEENRSQLRQTLKWYNLTFGTPPVRYWGDHGYLSEAADCGACVGAEND